MTPVVSAVWSCDPSTALAYPARYLFTFLGHHGLLGIKGSPQWRTVTGGSRSYVDKVAAVLPDVRTGSPVPGPAPRRRRGGHHPRAAGDETAEKFDAVVIATHPAQALPMLEDACRPRNATPWAACPTRSTRRSSTATTPCCRPATTPRRPGTTGCPSCDARPDRVLVSYDMTRLQRLEPVDGKRYIVSLGESELIGDGTVLEQMVYEHPQYTPDSLAPSSRSWALATAAWRSPAPTTAGVSTRTARSPASAPPRGWDASGTRRRGDETASLQAAGPRRGHEQSGSHLPHLDRARPAHPAAQRLHLPQLQLVRRRRCPPRAAAALRPLAGFTAADHLGDPDGTLRGNVERYLATQDIDLDGGRITMLASARVFGHVFNPLSLFWCHDAAGELRCVVAEVHNTYGERHCYLLETDDAGRATVPKAFYVSPFNDVDGQYRMKLPEPAERLAVSIVLEREGQKPFVATWTASAATPPCRTSSPRRSPSRWRRCGSRRRSAGRESNFGHDGCPSSKDHTTPHRRQSSDHDRSDRIPRQGSQERDSLRPPPDPRCRTPCPQAPAVVDAAHLAEHRDRPRRPQGPVAGRVADAIFRTAVRRLPLEVRYPDGSVLGKAGRTGPVPR